MRRAALLAAVAATVLAAGLAAVATGPAVAQDTSVSISGVDATPASPAPGEPFTVTTNVSNLGSSDGPIRVTDVFVRERGEPTEYARTEDLGSVAEGNSLSVPLTTTIDQPGQRNLRVHVHVETASGERRTLKHPLYVTVERPDDVLLSIPTTSATPGGTTPVNVTVANGRPGAISSVELTLSGNGTVENPERITAAVDGGVDRSFEYDVGFAESGPHSLTATLTYTTGEGATRTVEETATVDVGGDGAGSGIEGQIRLTGVEASGSGVVTLQGDAANVGGTDVKSVLLSVVESDSVSPMGSNGEHFVGAVNASDFDTFELIAQVDQGTGAVPVRIEYIVGGERRSEVVDVNTTSTGGTGGQDRFGRDEQRPNHRTPRLDREPRGGGGGLPGPGSLLVPAVAVVGLPAGYYLLKRR